MGHPVEGLGEVHDENICLFSLIQVIGEFVYEAQKLALTGPTTSEAMLLLADVFSKAHEGAHKDVFQDLAWNA